MYNKNKLRERRIKIIEIEVGGKNGNNKLFNNTNISGIML